MATDATSLSAPRQPSNATNAESTAGSAFGKLIEEQLEEQRARKKSVEERGAAIVTSSGAIVTLLFGLSALVTAVEGFTPSGQERFVLAAAAAAFFIAAIAGLVTNFPWPYREAMPDSLAEWVEKRWDEPGRSGEEQTARTRIAIWRTAREVNGRKVKFLFAGMALEVAAITLVALAVIDILSRGALLSGLPIPTL